MLNCKKLKENERFSRFLSLEINEIIPFSEKNPNMRFSILQNNAKRDKRGHFDSFFIYT